VSGHDRIAPDDGGTGIVSLPVWGPVRLIGNIVALDGVGTVTRSDGPTGHLKIGDPVFEGDIVETGAPGRVGIRFIDGTVVSLSDSARMVLKSFAGEKHSSSTLFNVTQGTFAFVAGEGAAAERFTIDTPFGNIRGHNRSRGVGTLSFAALFFAALDQVQAGDDDTSIVENGNLYEQVPHGDFTLTFPD